MYKYSRKSTVRTDWSLKVALLVLYLVLLQVPGTGTWLLYARKIITSTGKQVVESERLERLKQKTIAPTIVTLYEVRYPTEYLSYCQPLLITLTCTTGS